MAPVVMLRAYGSEPVKMLVVGHVITVGKRNPRHYAPLAKTSDGPSLNFAVEDVYEFEQATFDELKAAYKSGNVGLLKELWGKATLFMAR